MPTLQNSWEGGNISSCTKMSRGVKGGGGIVLHSLYIATDKVGY